MNLAMGVPLRVATATSNLMIGITAAASAVIYLSAARSTRTSPARPRSACSSAPRLGSRVAHRIGAAATCAGCSWWSSLYTADPDAAAGRLVTGGTGSARPRTAASSTGSSAGCSSRVTYVAVVLLSSAWCCMLANGISPLEPAGRTLDLEQLVADLAALDAGGFLWLGILAVIATPISRVIAAAIGFARLGDRRMVAVAVAILAVIALGVAIGAADRRCRPEPPERAPDPLLYSADFAAPRPRRARQRRSRAE